MKTRTTLILILTIIITFAVGSAFAKYSGGTGEPNDPYQISDTNDLLLLAADANDYGKSFILTADINMEGQVFTTAIIAADTNGNTPFTGTFDGDNHTISNLTITASTQDYIGLFGYIGSGGQIRNLGVDDVDITGHDPVGGLVGYNSGTLTACYATGSVSGTNDVGGLVGFGYGGSISNCYSTGSVSGTSNVGGLVGGNVNSGELIACYSTGVVSGTSDIGGLVGINVGDITACYSTGAVSGSAGVGGLVGYDFVGSISNCYSMGTVSGQGYVGGLVGGSEGSSINNCYATGSVIGTGEYSYYIGGLVGEVGSGTITACYATGAVSGTDDFGGLVGYNYTSTGIIVSSFWDINTSGQTTSAGGTGETTAEMKKLSTFTSAGWDFVNTWGIGNGQTYPYLKPFSKINPADLNYDGTVDFADFAILAANWLSGE